MGQWPTVPLGSVVEFLDHLRKPVKASERIAGPYPYYGANGQQGTIDGYIFDEPLLLLAEDGGHFDDPARGIAYRISGRSWVNNHAHVLRMTPTLDLDYAYAALANMDVRKYITGTTRSKLTKAGAARIEIPLPPMDEQRRIAAILDHADALGAKRNEIVNCLKQLERSLFETAFSDALHNTTAILDELADVSSGITKGRRTAEATRPIPYLAVANVQSGHLDLSHVKEIDATETEINRYALKDGDLVLTEGGDPDKLGRGTVWRDELPLCLHQNHIFRVRVSSDLLDPDYLSAYLASTPAKAYFLRAAKQTTGIASINMTQLRDTPIYLPPLDEQHEYLRRIREVAALRSCAESQAKAFDELQVSLESRAFSGQL